MSHIVQENQLREQLAEKIVKSQRPQAAEKTVHVQTSEVVEKEFCMEYKMHDLGFRATGEGKNAPQDISDKAQTNIDKLFCEKSPVISIADPLDQAQFDVSGTVSADLGEMCQIVGDDVLVTKPKRVEKAVDSKACDLMSQDAELGDLTAECGQKAANVRLNQSTVESVTKRIVTHNPLGAYSNIIRRRWETLEAMRSYHYVVYHVGFLCRGNVFAKLGRFFRHCAHSYPQMSAAHSDGFQSQLESTL